ncbi:MAG: RsmE family RNA methyltransferase [Candidatus Gracilibacteria bacterium]|nr:RsmE family RNA methyltransferase [Candidatus Gracilibacteria bacterium]
MVDDKDFFHQISHVLRSRINDEVVLFNGDGFEYTYGISEITKKGINLGFKEKTHNKADLEVAVNLYQALPNKYEKIEFIIQKGSEIGIRKFVFFNSERSQKLIINDKKIERFNFIIKEAIEQCGGNIMPEIIFSEKMDLSGIRGKILVCHTKKPEDGKSVKKGGSEEINLFVGPEGGFSDKEIQELEKNGGEILNFGDRILRTETTGIVVLFSILNKIIF